MTQSKSYLKKSKNRELYLPIRKGGKTPVVEEKSLEFGAKRKKDSFLTSTLKLVNMNLNNDTRLSSSRPESIDKSRNGLMKYSTYSEQASIAKLSRLNLPPKLSRDNSQSSNRESKNFQILSNNTNSGYGSSFEGGSENRYGRFSKSKNLRNSSRNYNNGERLGNFLEKKLLQTLSSASLVQVSKDL